jgi:hypothetical protein
VNDSAIRLISEVFLLWCLGVIWVVDVWLMWVRRLERRWYDLYLLVVLICVVGSTQDQSYASPDGPTNSSSDHDNDPTFPRGSPVHQNRARMGRLNYRRIDSVSSLLFRHTLLSYPHVMPHGRVYKAQGAPLQRHLSTSLLSHPLDSLRLQY